MSAVITFFLRVQNNFKTAPEIEKIAASRCNLLEEKVGKALLPFQTLFPFWRGKVSPMGVRWCLTPALYSSASECRKWNWVSLFCYPLQICSLLRGGIAERGGVRVGHRIIEINGQSVVAVPHEKIVNLLATSVGEVSSKQGRVALPDHFLNYRFRFRSRWRRCQRPCSGYSRAKRRRCTFEELSLKKNLVNSML